MWPCDARCFEAEGMQADIDTRCFEAEAMRGHAMRAALRRRLCVGIVFASDAVHGAVEAGVLWFAHLA